MRIALANQTINSKTRLVEADQAPTPPQWLGLLGVLGSLDVIGSKGTTRPKDFSNRGPEGKAFVYFLKYSVITPAYPYIPTLYKSPSDILIKCSSKYVTSYYYY